MIPEFSDKWMNFLTSPGMRVIFTGLILFIIMIFITRYFKKNLG